MRIYFSGIGGVGVGPLAQLALDAGYDVLGSDLQNSAQTAALISRGAEVFIGQTGKELADAHASTPIDWFVYTGALPETHPELVYARENNIRVSKRDELLATIIKDRELKLIAVSGTHGKTTTTGMLIWVFAQLVIPSSYSVGTSISYGPSGKYDENSEYFIYECDEFDRNMLHFYPYHSVITSLDYDHFETYPTLEDYRNSFVTFLEQSDYAVLWERDLRYLHRPDIATDYEAYDELMDLSTITLPGAHNRQNAYLVMRTMMKLFPELDKAKILATINSFPGTGRRFEKLADNLYTDYGHHPAEIKATLQLAHEVSDHVVLVYQPHQNVRQHEIKDDYPEALASADKIYWLPTYLARETEGQEILTPEQLTADLPQDKVEIADLNDELWNYIQTERDNGHLVLIMGAGSIDGWLRDHVSQAL